MYSKTVMLGVKEQSYQRGCLVERLKILYSAAKDINSHRKNPNNSLQYWLPIQKIYRYTNDPDAMKRETQNTVHIQSYLWYYFPHFIMFINYPWLICDYFLICTNFPWNNFQSMAFSLHMQFIHKKLLLIVSDLSWLCTNTCTLVFQCQLTWSANNCRDYSVHLFPERAQKFPTAVAESVFPEDRVLHCVVLQR